MVFINIKKSEKIQTKVKYLNSIDKYYSFLFYLYFKFILYFLFNIKKI